MNVKHSGRRERLNMSRIGQEMVKIKARIREGLKKSI